MKVIETTWNAKTRILNTQLKGRVSEKDAAAWELSLDHALKLIPANTEFKILLDLEGFEPENIQAHKAMRNIIPFILARHGLRPAFVDLFDEKPELPIKITNGIRCTAFANVHHDRNKMADYRKRIGQKNQQFFTDSIKAQDWLLSLP